MNEPSKQEVYSLLALLDQKKYLEVESVARAMTKDFPYFTLAKKVLGVVLLHMGRERDALSTMQTVVALSPNDSEAHNNLGVILACLGRLVEAEAIYRRAIQIKPDYFVVHNSLGTILDALGKQEEAVECYRQAVRFEPNYVEAHHNLGGSLMNIGRFEEALMSFQQVLSFSPNSAEAHFNLGMSLIRLNRLCEAEKYLLVALEINPIYAEAHHNLGYLLDQLGRYAEAEIFLRQALELEPDLAEAHNNLGINLMHLNRLDEAESSFRCAIAIKPDYAVAYSNLGFVLDELGQPSNSEIALRRALELEPNYALAHNNLGNALRHLGRTGEAKLSLQQAIALKPDYAEAYYNLGVVLNDLGQLEEAEKNYRQALKIKPELVDAYSSLGNTLLSLNRLDEAEASLRQAITLKPDFVDAYTNLLFCLSHNSKVDSATLFSEHRRFGEQFETPFLYKYEPHIRMPDKNRSLKIGFVSGDFHNHAVVNYIDPVLKHLANSQQLSLYGYYNNTIEDSVTQRLRGYMAHWRQVSGLSDNALEQQIRADSIDILIDLSGHTANHRLLVFARKPAPIQASWIGYLGTTGLRAMDYYLTDRFFLPFEQFAHQFTEKLVHMPAIAPFMPSNIAPMVNILPALKNGFMTFGSFNRSNKLSQPVIALWAKLLRSLPDSRMLLGGLPEDGKSDLLEAWFAHEGISSDRLIFHPRSQMHTYLELHHHVDICLDAFPYNAGSTNLHALWMGVPTLSLAGDTPASRHGASFLNHVGLESFVAQDATDFVQKGLSWADNIAELATVRVDLRERLQNSTLGKPKLIAEGLQQVFRIMWHRWCDGLAAQSFVVGLSDIDNVNNVGD